MQRSLNDATVCVRDERLQFDATGSVCMCVCVCMCVHVRACACMCVCVYLTFCIIEKTFV